MSLLFNESAQKAALTLLNDAERRRDFENWKNEVEREEQLTLDLGDGVGVWIFPTVSSCKKERKQALKTERKRIANARKLRLKEEKKVLETPI